MNMITTISSQKETKMLFIPCTNCGTLLDEKEADISDRILKEQSIKTGRCLCKECREIFRNDFKESLLNG